MRKIFYILILLLFPILRLHAVSEYYFKQLSLGDGLSHPTVNSILCDKNGYIWIGTMSGLNRFDKYEIKSYFNEENDSSSLYSNKISFIKEDECGNLWIGAGVLSLYNSKDDNFSIVKYNGKTIDASSACLVDDGIIFGGWSLFKYSYSTKQITQLIQTKQIKDKISYIYRWNGKILLGSKWDGLWVYDEKTSTLDRIFIKEKHISACYVDSKGNLWVSVYGKGLECYSADGKMIVRLTVENSDLSHNTVLDVLERNDEIWIATDGGGICIYDLLTEHIDILKNIPDDNNSIISNSITCLYLDKNKYVWAGTVREGLLAIRNVKMRTYKGSPSYYGMTENAAISLYEDNDNIIWVGTDGGGLNRFDLESGHFKHIKQMPDAKIVSITEFGKDELLIYTFDNGLYIFDKKTETFKGFVFINSKVNEKMRLSGLNTYVHKVNNDKIYFFSDSVYEYSLNTHKFKVVKYEFEPKPYYVINTLISFSEEKDSIFLFSQKDIFSLNYDRNALHLIYHLPVGITVNGVSRDSSGNFWFGTNRGLAVYNVKTKELKYVGTGLFHEVNSVLCDDKNRVWFGAKGMLFSYLIDKEQFIVWGESDGVLPNEYFPQASIIAKNGDILMGGASGLLRIKSDIDLELESSIGISLAGVTVDGSSLVDNNGNIPEKIKLPWSYNSLYIKINDDDIDIFRKKFFRFKIVGDGTENIIDLMDHTLAVHSLAPGKYTVYASCSLRNGNWSTPCKVIEIVVSPPWWKSRLFLFSVCSFFVLFILLSSLLVIRKREKMLKRQIKEREKKIDKDKIRFLINISHELRTPLTLVYSPLKRLLDNRELDPSVRSILVNVYKQSKNMVNILNMVLDIRKMEVGQEKLSVHQHLLNEWIRNVSEDFRLEYENKNISLKYSLDDNIKYVCFDDKKCGIVLSNLLMNALKFSLENSTINIVSEIVENGNKVRISVKDEGIGLGNIDPKKLFVRFSQGEHNFGGSGIGLSYSKTLIEMHGGAIGAFDNADGPGATFFFELPLSGMERDDVCEVKPYINELFVTENNKEEQEIIDFETKNYSVIIVEDEYDLRKFIYDFLSPYFKNVYCAGNGEEALEIIRDKYPDIIISDAMMPVMNGFELCNEVKSDMNISHIPVVLLTAMVDEESRKRGYKIGADVYLEKPFDSETLMNILCNLLRSREKLKKKYNTNLYSDSKAEVYTNSEEEFLKKLDLAINENLENGNIDVSLIVDKIGLSRTALYNKVKQMTGMGVNEYITKVRIEKAVTMLLHTDLQIAEISDKLGYKNQSYFSTAFKQMIGVSPSKYRDEFKKNDKE